MILIHFNGTSIPAQDNGTLIAPPSYWGEDILTGIANAFANGHYEAMPEPVPEPPQTRSVDMRRLRLALHQMDLLDTVDAAIAGMPRAAQIEWEFATNVQSDHPLVLQIATALSLNINQIFDLAETFT